jgi:glycerophosphoryl diester phosphodiesterase
MGRGVVDGHVENTLESFQAAVAAGADWVEADVGRTADDELFVLHDSALAEGVFLSDATARTAVEHGAVCRYLSRTGRGYAPSAAEK